ncbi:TPA: hypothetical protein PEP05_000784 [Vibrio parahaemolyticus]|nr:hypothetical protein [Vibrio parahaemolyticus]
MINSNIKKRGITELRKLKENHSKCVKFSESTLVEFSESVKSALLGVLGISVSSEDIESTVEIIHNPDKSHSSTPITTFDDASDETKTSYEFEYKINLSDAESICVDVLLLVDTLSFESTKRGIMVINKFQYGFSLSASGIIDTAKMIYNEAHNRLSS